MYSRFDFAQEEAVFLQFDPSSEQGYTTLPYAVSNAIPIYTLSAQDDFSRSPDSAAACGNASSFLG